MLSLLTASYIFCLCQALDLRALHIDLQTSLSSLLRELLAKHFPSALSALATPQQGQLVLKLERGIARALEATNTADGGARLKAVADSTTTPLIDLFLSDATAFAGALPAFPAFRTEFAQRGADTLALLQKQYLEGERGATPASKHVGKSRRLYEFVRTELNVRMYGVENLHNFAAGPGVEETSIGENISLIHEAIRDGKMQSVVMDILKSIKA